MMWAKPLHHKAQDALSEQRLRHWSLGGTKSHDSSIREFMPIGGVRIPSGGHDHLYIQ